MEPSSLATIETPEGPRVRIAGKDYDWFRGSGYLGLYGHPEILRAACEATQRYGMKLRAKRSVGCHPCLLELEHNARRFFATEAIAYFNSGYCGNSVLLSALEDRFDAVFVDEYSHFSVLDAARACGKPVFQFAHRDPESLRTELKRHLRARQEPLVMSDSIFPASGRIAPASDYWSVLGDQDRPLLCIDDAHGAGVLGAHGRGLYEYLGMEGPGRYSCTTMSKAFGSHGGLIATDSETLAKVESRSGVYRGASPPPPGVTAASAKALEVVLRDPKLRQHLTANVSYLRRGLHDLGLEVEIDSPSPIICLEYRLHAALNGLAPRLFEERGIAVLEMQGGYSGVPQGGALLFTVFANHTTEQLDRLLEAFRCQL